LVDRLGSGWRQRERRVAARAIKNVRRGAGPPCKSRLGAIRTRNAASVIRHRRLMTDTIANWVIRGFVCGPFDSPPWPNARLNPLMAVEQANKVRPIMNMSAPPGRSTNDSIDEARLPKLTMSTARDFSYSVLEAGRGALMWKFDLKDAFKNILISPPLWPTQGFTWLGKIFIDTVSVFGSKLAPADFDCLGETVAALALANSDLPRRFLHCTLDDTPIVCPRIRPWGDAFANNDRRVCQEVGLTLAAAGPYSVKAFSRQTRGTVLGYTFRVLKGQKKNKGPPFPRGKAVPYFFFWPLDTVDFMIVPNLQ